MAERGPYYTVTDGDLIRPHDADPNACEHLARAIRNARRERDMTQEQWAKKLGIKRSRLAHWETCRRAVPYRDAERIAETIGIDPNDLERFWGIRWPLARLKPRSGA